MSDFFRLHRQQFYFFLAVCNIFIFVLDYIILSILFSFIFRFSVGHAENDAERERDEKKPILRFLFFFFFQNRNWDFKKVFWISSADVNLFAGTAKLCVRLTFDYFSAVFFVCVCVSVQIADNCLSAVEFQQSKQRQSQRFDVI